MSKFRDSPEIFADHTSDHSRGTLDPIPTLVGTRCSSRFFPSHGKYREIETRSRKLGAGSSEFAGVRQSWPAVLAGNRASGERRHVHTRGSIGSLDNSIYHLLSPSLSRLFFFFFSSLIRCPCTITHEKLFSLKVVE